MKSINEYKSLEVKCTDIFGGKASLDRTSTATVSGECTDTKETDSIDYNGDGVVTHTYSCTYYDCA